MVDAAGIPHPQDGASHTRMTNARALAGMSGDVRDVYVVNVFGDAPTGGNPAPVMLDADTMSAAQMQAVAAAYGHESAFVCAPQDKRNGFRLRFFVPNHEMEMCGHATLGALWLLREHGRWTGAATTVETLSGIVQARIDPASNGIQISQPRGRVEVVEHAALRDRIGRALSIDAGALAPLPIVNATTSRTKTLIPLDSVERLHALAPAFDDMPAVCDALGSTGLYPIAVDRRASTLTIHARQFPRSSGYPEDAATGIAATAAFYGLLHYGLIDDPACALTVLQGYAMGRPSRIRVMSRHPVDPGEGCWLSGAVGYAMQDGAR